MKKLVQILTAAVVSVAFVGSVAGAQECDNIVIFNTGPDSNNQVSCVDVTNLTVTCVNNVFVLDTNSQTALTGSASVAANVTSGNALSGDANNSNGQVVTIGASCVSATTPVTPVTPGGGSVTPAAETKVAALPYTAGTSAATIVAISLVAAAAIVAVSRIAIAAYRRYSVK